MKVNKRYNSTTQQDHVIKSERDRVFRQIEKGGFIKNKYWLDKPYYLLCCENKNRGDDNAR